MREIFHDATFAKERAQELFNSGVLSLRERAMAEQLYLGDDERGRADRRSGTATSTRTSSTDLDATLVDRYFCNFSLFQSLPDSWAIDQLFPIMPIHRLDEEPTRRGTLQDVTCDSDGKIDRFVGDEHGASRASSCTRSRDGEPYMLGIFLTGAYQEILGDLHNLFGDTNAVHVRLVANSGYEITDLVHGDTVTEVLNYVQFRASDLLPTFRRKVANATSARAAGGEHVHRRLRRRARGVHVPRGRGGAVATRTDQRAAQLSICAARLFSWTHLGAANLFSISFQFTTFHHAAM